ncbi:MAG: carbohydrate ABC transporter permease, partial [Anaerobacillus sp.]
MKINKERKNLFSVEVLGLVLGIIWIAPFYLMIVNAFKTKREIFTGVLGLPKSLALENFVQAFNDLEFLKSLFNSLLITGVSVAIIILFSAMAGYALARNKSKLSGIIFFVFVAAMLIP